MLAHNLPDGATIKTFPKPVEGFDLLTADEKTLRLHGLPPKPTDHKLAELWEHVARHCKEYVVPSFAPQIGKVHGPRARRPDSTDGSPNWSGGVVYAPAGKKMQSVVGQWNVPAVHSRGGDGVESCCSSWIGIDGDGSGDVCQAGVEGDVIEDADGNTQWFYYAWAEWYPTSPAIVQGFTISPGDVVACAICVSTESDRSAGVTMTNLTTGQYTSFNITAPFGTHLIGNCAEWVVERPGYGPGDYTRLAYYDQVMFTGAYATLNDGTGDVIDGATGDSIYMTDDAGTIISVGQLVPPAEITCTCKIN
jgi:hypothetical protein